MQLAVSKATPRIPGLDGLRAMAIMLVLGSHYVGKHAPEWGWTLAICNGEVGVRIFFCLSGFLITHIALKELGTGNFSYRHFFFRRASKILPTMYVYIGLISLLAWLAYSIFPIVGLARALTFTVFDWRILDNDLLTHFWSLSVEECFYLMWVPILVSAKPKHRNTFIFFFLVLSPVCRLINHAEDYFYTDIIRRTLGLPLIPVLGHFDVLMWGALFALNRERVAKGWDRLSPGHRQALAYLSLVVLLSPVFRKEIKPQIFWQTIGVSVQTVATIVLMLSLMSHTRTKLHDFFKSRLMIEIGLASYSIYLFQQPFFFWFPNMPLPRWQTYPVTILLAIIVGLVVYRWVERPILNFARDWYQKKKMGEWNHKEKEAA